MKTISYFLTILFFSLLLSCSEEPPTNIGLENLDKKPAPPPQQDPLVLLDGPNQVAGIRTVTQGSTHKGIIQVWDYQSGYTKTWELEKDGSFQVCTIGDADNDGHDELVAVYSFETGRGRNKVTHWQLQVFENDDTDEPSSFIELTNNGMWKLVVADANSDGLQEIVGGSRQHISVFKDEEGTISELWESEDIYDDLLWDLEVGDADNDINGQNEIVYAGLAVNKFAVYKYLGGNSWGNKVYSEPTSGPLDQAKVADVDNDGANEVIGGGAYGKLTVWEHENGAYVIAFESEDLGGFTQGVCAGDFDYDGYNEIAVGSAEGNGGNVYVFEYEDNTYVNIFTEAAGGTADMFAGDSDNDGKVEFVLAGGGLWVYDYEGSYIQSVIDAEVIFPVMIK